MSEAGTIDVAPQDESQGSASDSNHDNEDPEAVETLIAGRDRRATAGNRMANLIEREDDDEVALLFTQEDDEEDVDFEESDEGASDAQLGSSSDDEDRGTAATGENELGGERELQQEAKAQKAKKRKAQETFTTVSGLQKKVKIAPTTTSAPTSTRSNKKPDRLSWLPDVHGGPIRASARKQTVENKEVTHARLKDHAVKRAKILAQMRKAEREREKHRPKQMTQADRLAEAAETEKKNSQSLNRWEETERKRAEEQAAKLAALKARKLEGPVMTWWSGVAAWSGTRLIRIGPKETDQEMLVEPKKRGRKPKHNLDASSSLKGEAHSVTSTPQDLTATPAPQEPPLQSQPTKPDERTQPSQNPSTDLMQAATKPVSRITEGPENTFLQGIQEYATLPSENGSVGASQAPSEAPGTPNFQLELSRASAQPQDPALLPDIKNSVRNLVVLTDFENLSPAERGEFNIFYHARKPPKLAKTNQHLCPISSLPAHYRDRDTGVAYANSNAYRTLRELKENKYIWSGMLGCFVGTAGLVARSVPDGFLSTP